MKIVICLCGVLLFTFVSLSPVTSSATPISYSLSGTVFDTNQSVTLQGSITLDDQFILGSAVNTFGFRVLQFSIVTDTFTFSGNAGGIGFDASVVIGGQRLVDGGIWALDGSLSSGAFSDPNYQWIGEGIRFLNNDLVPIDRTFDQYSNLSSNITFDGPNFGDPLPGSPPGLSRGGNISLHAVPEAPVLFSLVIGFIGLVISSRWRNPPESI